MQRIFLVCALLLFDVLMPEVAWARTSRCYTILGICPEQGPPTYWAQYAVYPLLGVGLIFACLRRWRLSCVSLGVTGAWFVLGAYTSLLSGCSCQILLPSGSTFFDAVLLVLLAASAALIYLLAREVRSRLGRPQPPAVVKSDPA